MQKAQHPAASMTACANHRCARTSTWRPHLLSSTRAITARTIDDCSRQHARSLN